MRDLIETLGSGGEQRSFVEFMCELCGKRLAGDKVRRVDITVSRIPECITNPNTRLFICYGCWGDAGHTVHPGEELAIVIARGFKNA